MPPPTSPEEAVASSVLHPSLFLNPPTITSAKGHYLHTSTGATLFDASGGAAVSCIGHANPRIKAAITTQLASLEYAFAPHFTTPAYEALATFLAASTAHQLPKVFVVGSGSEAVEACLKLARQYFVEVEGPETKRVRFIARERSYHGNTLGSLSVSGHAARRAVYEPLLSANVSFVPPYYPYRDLLPGESTEAYVARLVQALDDEFLRVGPDTVCAVLFETVAGITLGAVAPPQGYLAAMKAVCERHGALFILDEVLAGMGRTGTLHAWEQEAVVPDLQTVAKGLGAGYAPIGALLVGTKVVDVLSKGTGAFVHFHTYHGHPVSCAAAYAVQQVVREDGLVQNCRDMGAYLGTQLHARLSTHKHVGDIRGRGLVWAIELVKDRTTKAPFPAAQKVGARIHAAGLSQFQIVVLPGGGVADGVNGDLICLAPAYTVTREDVELVVERTARAIESVLGKTGVEAKL